MDTSSICQELSVPKHPLPIATLDCIRHGQPSFDKQFARDWLKANPDNNWTLPQEIVDKTINKYLQGYEMLTGKKLGE